MKEQVNQFPAGIKTVLMGTEMIRAFTKHDVYYIDVRFCNGNCPLPKAITVEADWKMMKRILDCLPFMTAFGINAVVQANNIYNVEPPERIELPIIRGTLTWSKALGRPCIEVEDVEYPDAWMEDEEEEPEPDPLTYVY